MQLERIAAELRDRVDTLSFAPPVTHVYNPLSYAWHAHRQYLRRYGNGTKQVLLVGMNPGPFGMVQTGVPFGDVTMVRDWLDLLVDVEPPGRQHPKRPIHGAKCRRSEVSGTRLWGWARRRFGTPERFFSQFFVWNYCPLCFLEDSGRNRTPDKLSLAERQALLAICDSALEAVVQVLSPRYALGIGGFAASRIARLTLPPSIVTGRLLHPSPANPHANRSWEQEFEKGLRSLGVELPAEN